jgi:hypothetical protein
MDFVNVIDVELSTILNRIWCVAWSKGIDSTNLLTAGEETPPGPAKPRGPRKKQTL